MSREEQKYPRGIPAEGRRSKFEANVENQLRNLGVIPSYEPDELPYECTYVPDFRLPNGIYIECKGYFTPEDRSKMLKVKQRHPCLDIRMIFMSDNKIHSKSSMRYSDWCKKHGFLYAIKNVPEEWTKEKEGA